VSARSSASAIGGGGSRWLGDLHLSRARAAQADADLAAGIEGSPVARASGPSRAGCSRRAAPSWSRGAPRWRLPVNVNQLSGNGQSVIAAYSNVGYFTDPNEPYPQTGDIAYVAIRN